MKTKIIFLSVLLVSISACDAFNASSNTNSVVVIDLDKIAIELGRDEKILQEISEHDKKLSEQLKAVANELQEKIKQEQAALTEKSTEEEKQAVQQLITQAQQRLRNEQAAAQQNSQQKRQEMVAAFRDEVKAVAEQVAKASGAKMIKVISDDVLWFDAQSDITDEVAAKMKPAAEQ